MNKTILSMFNQKKGKTLSNLPLEESSVSIAIQFWWDF